MIIITENTTLENIKKLEKTSFFPDMVKAVVDIEQELIAVNGELHADLEELLLNNGSKQQSLYGINIYFGNGEIEFDSMINPPRNLEAGFPRGGRGVADPIAREKIVKVVNKWITI